MRSNRLRHTSSSRICRVLAVCAALAGSAFAGGPRWVTGTSYFSQPGVQVAWANGQVLYFTDQGPLSASVDNATANAMVAAAAAPWNGVLYSMVNISAAGTLAEDVNGSNTYAGANGVVFPDDVLSTNTAEPLAIIYDADGSVTDAMLGQGASGPESCWQNGVTESVDNMRQDGAIVHAHLVLNGRCTGSGEQQLQMRYQLERMFGRVLGLDWSQLNDNVFTGTPTPKLADERNWPLMHPIDIRCGPYAYQCMVDPFTLRMDDRAALARLYPVTWRNASQFPGKKDIYANSIGIIGKVMFPDGQPMEGLNVVTYYVSPDYNRQWAGQLVSSVTGYLFRGNAGNPATGLADAAGNRFDAFGGVNAYDEGLFSILGMDQTLEAGRPWEYVAFYVEPVNPLYTGEFSVGPYTLNQVQPSGVVTPFAQGVVANGANYYLQWTANGAAVDRHGALDGTESAPAAVPSTGFWNEQLTDYGHTGWYGINVKANRSLTVEALAMDGLGYATTAKAMPAIGLWNGTDALGSAADASAAAFNGASNGRTTLTASTTVAETLRIAIADQRGDGRPDYIYQARVLYADSILPAQVAIGGASVTIAGLGFRAGNAVTIDGVQANVQQITANQITFNAPPLALLAGVAAGTALDVTVSDPATGASTTMLGSVTYSSTSQAVTAQLLVISGGAQSITAAGTLAPLLLEVTDGAGHGVARALVQVYQTVTGYQDCQGRGRCAAAPLLGTANTAEMSDVNGMVSVDPLQIAGRPLTLNVVATAESRGLIRVVLAKHP